MEGCGDGLPIITQLLHDLQINIDKAGGANYFGYTLVGYQLTPEDLEAEVVDWTRRFLLEIQCPDVIASILTRNVFNELAEHPELFSPPRSENKILLYEANKVRAAIVHKVLEICENWKIDNEMQHQLLDSYVKLKDSRHKVSVCAIKNGRRKMEDRHVVIPDLNTLCNIQAPPYYSYYAIFDGHGGTDAALFSASHLHFNLIRHELFETDVEAALKGAFKITDEKYLEKAKRDKSNCGTTVVCSLVKDRRLYIAWLGDSQACLVKNGKNVMTIEAHIPSRQDEQMRITALGGSVLFYGTWRVGGTLAVSRAIGDLSYKPYVCSEPDVTSVELDGTEDFLVMGCDGLWDTITPENVIMFVHRHLVETNGDIETVSEALVQQAKAKGSNDNITAIIIFLNDIDLQKSEKILSSAPPIIKFPDLERSNGFESKPEFVCGGMPLMDGINTNGDSKEMFQPILNSESPGDMPSNYTEVPTPPVDHVMTSSGIFRESRTEEREYVGENHNELSIDQMDAVTVTGDDVRSPATSEIYVYEEFDSSPGEQRRQEVVADIESEDTSALSQDDILELNEILKSKSKTIDVDGGNLQEVIDVTEFRETVVTETREISHELEETVVSSEVENYVIETTEETEVQDSSVGEILLKESENETVEDSMAAEVEQSRLVDVSVDADVKESSPDDAANTELKSDSSECWLLATEISETVINEGEETSGAELIGESYESVSERHVVREPNEHASDLIESTKNASLVEEHEQIESKSNEINVENVTESSETVAESTETVVESSETVAESSGTVAKSMETVMESSETVTESSGTVAESMETVMESSGTVMELSGTVVETMETVTESSETVAESSGTVAKSMETVVESSETVAESSGTVAKSMETVMESSETVTESSGTVAESMETVMESSGTVVELSGTVVETMETVTESSETVAVSHEVITESNEIVTESSEIITESEEVPMEPNESVVESSETLVTDSEENVLNSRQTIDAESTREESSFKNGNRQTTSIRRESVGEQVIQLESEIPCDVRDESEFEDRRERDLVSTNETDSQQFPSNGIDDPSENLVQHSVIDKNQLNSTNGDILSADLQLGAPVMSLPGIIVSETLSKSMEVIESVTMESSVPINKVADSVDEELQVDDEPGLTGRQEGAMTPDQANVIANEIVGEAVKNGVHTAVEIVDSPKQNGLSFPEIASEEQHTPSDMIIDNDLGSIPDGLPEADGVVEDEDSDNDHDEGWSYISAKASKTPDKKDMAAPAKSKTSKVAATAKVGKDVSKILPKTTCDKPKLNSSAAIQRKSSADVAKKVPSKAGKPEKTVGTAKTTITKSSVSSKTQTTKPSSAVRTSQSQRPSTTENLKRPKPASVGAQPPKLEGKSKPITSKSTPNNLLAKPTKMSSTVPKPSVSSTLKAAVPRVTSSTTAKNAGRTKAVNSIPEKKPLPTKTSVSSVRTTSTRPKSTSADSGKLPTRTKPSGGGGAAEVKTKPKVSSVSRTNTQRTTILSKTSPKEVKNTANERIVSTSKTSSVPKAAIKSTVGRQRISTNDSQKSCQPPNKTSATKPKAAVKTETSKSTVTVRSTKSGATGAKRGSPVKENKGVKETKIAVDKTTAVADHNRQVIIEDTTVVESKESYVAEESSIETSVLVNVGENRPSDPV